MAENKTRPTKISVAKFLNGIEDEKKRRDAKALDGYRLEIGPFEGW